MDEAIRSLEMIFIREIQLFLLSIPNGSNAFQYVNSVPIGDGPRMPSGRKGAFYQKIIMLLSVSDVKDI